MGPPRSPAAAQVILVPARNSRFLLLVTVNGNQKPSDLRQDQVPAEVAGSLVLELSQLFNRPLLFGAQPDADLL